MKKNLQNTVNVRIDEKLYNALQDLSEDSGVNFSTVIRVILQEYTRKYKENNF